jgi:hypothetical protein
MNKKAAILITILIVSLMVVSTVYAARETREAASSKVESKGVGGQFIDGTVCLFKCGWPAWILLILPPVAIWFYKRFISWG